MSYDLYVELGGKSQADVNALVNGQHRGYQISSIATRIQLLTGIAARKKITKISESMLSAATAVVVAATRAWYMRRVPKIPNTPKN